MARSLEEIDAEIAKVKAEMALRDRYTQGFNQPQTKVGWGSYIINNDRGLLDAYQNRENEWKNMLKQQEFQAAEAALNRKNAQEIAAMNKANSSGSELNEYYKLINNIELAEADYEAAKNSVDIDNPKSIADYKKMASKLNYLYRQLPKDIEGYSLVSLDDPTEDAPNVRKAKNKKWLDAHKDKNKLTEAEQLEYDKRMNELPEEEREAYKVIKKSKGSTVEEAETAELRNLRKLDAAGLLDSNQRKRKAELEKKYPKVK